MRFKLINGKINKSNKSQEDYLREDLLSDPNKKLNLEEMSSIMEKGISESKLKEILEEQRKLRESSERLKSKQ
jgi:hypothetical protein